MWKHCAMIVVIMATGSLAGCASTLEKYRSTGSGWMKGVRWGVFTHYLVSESNYNRMADSFDVDRFADQIEQTGADYLIFTLGQNSGYYCSPNATYERYVGCQPGERCTRRDLPMEIASALEKRGIRFLLYLSSRAPQFDPDAMAGLADIDERKRAPQEFIKRWSEVIEEWSLRYGRKVSGWWFDGTYVLSSWEDLSKPYNFRTWAAACRVGNPDSMLAFNNGSDIQSAFQILSPQEQDYTAGEQNRFGALPENWPTYPNKQWHVLSYLGTSWAHANGPTYTDRYLVDYVRDVNRQAGVVTIDVQVSEDGTIYPFHLKQLIALGKTLH